MAPSWSRMLFWPVLSTWMMAWPVLPCRTPPQTGWWTPARSSVSFRKCPSGPMRPGVPGLHPGPSQSHGLVQPLAAALDLQGLGAHGLSGLDEVVHPVDVVDIQGPEVDNAHVLLLPHAIKVVSSSSRARRLSTSTQMETPGASMGCSRRSATTMPRQKLPPHSTGRGWSAPSPHWDPPPPAWPAGRGPGSGPDSCFAVD